MSLSDRRDDRSQNAEAVAALRTAQQKWQEENREALENHNRYTEKYGLFSDGRRRF